LRRKNHKLQKLPCKKEMAKGWCSQPKKENKPHIVAAAAAQLVEKEDPQTAHNTANEEI
jgi:hypothetical protein